MQGLLRSWYYGVIGLIALKEIEGERRCRFPHLERKISQLAPRPLLMIHGGADTYIKPDIAQALFERAEELKEFLLVEGAKHNQALSEATEEDRRRVLDFFNQHLSDPLLA